jgi:hypothetical protein
MQVLNTIVEKVQLPEDRAIILAGYEQQISEMFRGANPGLSSRFDCDSPWRFDDFSDDDLLKVARSYIVKKGISELWDFNETLHLIKTVSKQRALFNFSNARAVETLRQAHACDSLTNAQKHNVQVYSPQLNNWLNAGHQKSQRKTHHSSPRHPSQRS